MLPVAVTRVTLAATGIYIHRRHPSDECRIRTVWASTTGRHAAGQSRLFFDCPDPVPESLVLCFYDGLPDRAPESYALVGASSKRLPRTPDVAVVRLATSIAHHVEKHYCIGFRDDAVPDEHRQ